MSSQSPMRVLLVEDNIHDIEITKRAFAHSPVKIELVVVRYGKDALDYLNHRGKYHPRNLSPRPKLILLDLNLPKIHGLEVLRRIKEDEHLKAIPVIVLTASRRNEDVVPAYELGANTYIQKPVEFADFMRVVSAIQEYWMGIAVLPRPVHETAPKL